MEQMIALWSMVMVHALMVAGLVIVPLYARLWAREDRRPAPSILGSLSNVVHNQAGSWPVPSAVETRAFHREARFSPGDQCYHWNNNCESYWRVGVAMGESMLELTSRRED